MTWKELICRLRGHDVGWQYDRTNSRARAVCVRCGAGGPAIPSMDEQIRAVKELKK